MAAKILSWLSLGILAILSGISLVACGTSQAAENTPSAQSAASAPAAPVVLYPGQVILPQDASRLGIDPTRYKAGEITRYTLDIAANPQNSVAYQGRAKALMDQGFAYNDKAPVLRAIADLTMAIHLDPSGGRQYIDRGIAYAYLNDKTRAELDFAKARSLSTNVQATDRAINDELRGMERQRTVSTYSK